MSLTKNYYWDQAEKAVDKIIVNLKNQLITESTAIKEILDVEAVALVGIDEFNVEEFIESELA